jgi:hypothetical protein
VRDRDALTFELQRRELIPKKKVEQRSRKGNPYALDKAHIDAKVAEYLGAEEEEEGKEEVA